MSGWSGQVSQVRCAMLGDYVMTHDMKDNDWYVEDNDWCVKDNDWYVKDNDSYVKDNDC